MLPQAKKLQIKQGGFHHGIVYDIRSQSEYHKHKKRKYHAAAGEQLSSM